MKLLKDQQQHQLPHPRFCPLIRMQANNMSHHQQLPASTTNSGQMNTRKKRRGMIEKKRRDKINNSLSELRRLVPAAFEKQGSAKLEKAEILQMTVDYLRMLHAHGLADSLTSSKQLDPSAAVQSATGPAAAPVQAPGSQQAQQQSPSSHLTATQLQAHQQHATSSPPKLDAHHHPHAHHHHLHQLTSTPAKLDNNNHLHHHHLHTLTPKLEPHHYGQHAASQMDPHQVAAATASLYPASYQEQLSNYYYH